MLDMIFKLVQWLGPRYIDCPDGLQGILPLHAIKSIDKISSLQDKALPLGFHQGLCVAPDAGFHHLVSTGVLAESCH